MSTCTNEKAKRPVSASAVTRLVIWSVVLAILLPLFVVGMWGSRFGIDDVRIGQIIIGGINYHYADDDSYLVGNGTSDKTVTAIEIEWVAGDITIIPAEDGVETISVSETYDGNDDDLQMRWRIMDGVLTIRHRAPHWGIGIFNRAKEKNLTVTLPKTMLDGMRKVSIEAVEGQVTYTGNADTFSAEGVDIGYAITGDVRDLDLDYVDGKVQFNGSVGEADLDGVEVDVTMHLTAASKMDIDGVDGKATLYLGSEITGFYVEWDGIAGDVMTEGFDGVTRGEESGTRRWGDGSLRIDVDGVDQDVTLIRTPEA